MDGRMWKSLPRSKEVPSRISGIEQTQGQGTPLHILISNWESYKLSSGERKEKQQKSVYYISKALQGAEVRYQKIEKLALALAINARMLQPYFQGHHIIVMTKHPIR